MEAERIRVITAEELAYFQQIFPGDRLFTGDRINPDYHRDELENFAGAAQLVIRVISTAEVSQIMTYAYKQEIPVVVRGSATGLVGGAVPTHGGIVIDMTLMNQITDLDRENLTVKAQAGVLLMDLAVFAENNGFLYPPDPGEKSATIGGNISTNAGGMRAVRYGVTRDYVLVLEVVMPDGEILELGSPVVKTSSGLNLKELVIGSEGILCVICAATLKLIPKPSCSTSVLVPFADMDEALANVPTIILSNTNPTAIECMERQTVLYAEKYLGRDFPDHQSEAYLLLTFDGVTEEEVVANYRKVADILLSRGAQDVYLVDTPERKKDVWSARGAFLLGIKATTPAMDECDVVVPRAKLAEFIRATHEISRETGMRLPSFGHAGDGNLHVYLCRDDREDDQWEKDAALVFKRLYAVAKELGGQVSGEHGIGLAKRSYLEESVGPTQMRLMRSIKQAFDPKGILNPGKVVGE